MSALLRRAIALYRACLRSAARCPASHHAEQMRALTRLKFADARRVRDASRVRALLDDGERELASLEYMHAVREAAAAGNPGPTFDAVQRDVMRALGAAGTTIATSRAELHAARSDTCRSCGHRLQRPAKFCSECGTRV